MRAKRPHGPSTASIAQSSVPSPWRQTSRSVSPNPNPNGAAAQAPSPAKRHSVNKSNVTAGEGRGEGETAAWSVNGIDRAIVCPQSVATDLQVCQPKSQPQRHSRASPLSRETTFGQQTEPVKANWLDFQQCSWVDRWITSATAPVIESRTLQSPVDENGRSAILANTP